MLYITLTGLAQWPKGGGGAARTQTTNRVPPKQHDTFSTLCTHPPTPASCAVSSRTSNFFSLLKHLQTHGYNAMNGEDYQIGTYTTTFFVVVEAAGPTSYAVYRCGFFGCLFRVHDKSTGKIPDELDRPRQRSRLLRGHPPHAPGLEARRRHGWSAATVPAVQVSAAQEVRPHPHEQPGRQKRLFPDVAGSRKG